LYDDPVTMQTKASLPPPAPLRMVTEGLSDRLAAHLARQIASAALRPGDRLPTEQQLAQTHGVSRTVVREAVHQLKSRGLLRSRQGSGVFVAAAPLRHGLPFDASVLDSVDAVVQVREVRRALEGETAALAATRASAAQIAVLRRALKAIDRSTAAGGDGVEEDLAFHRALTDAACNPQFGRLLEFLEQYLTEAMRVTRGHEALRLDFMEQVRAEHAAIVEAVAARKPYLARRRAVEHMRRGDRRLQIAGLVPAGADGARPGKPRPAPVASAPRRAPKGKA
jgi:GntR family transcriptional regulator, transcriptional repressor for pyruvate dehydrogenase complex